MDVKKVLLAEDDHDDQDFFKGFLKQRLDIEIMPIAENGVELFDTLEMIRDNKHLPHLIILDQNMPKRNGLQTLQLLKSTTRYAGIPIIVYSTYADHKLKTEGLANGALDVMTKPINKDGYNEMIDVFLRATE
jgi:DNA-binding response OmpR family regulator